MRKLYGFLLSFFLMLMVASPASAAEYVVKEGDSLWSIARHYGTSVDKLMEANRLSSDKLKLGMKLMIPGEGTAAKGAEPVVGQVVSTYTVRQGDSLWAVARRLGVSVDALKVANGLQSDLLRPGMTLKIPAKSNSGSQMATAGLDQADVACQAATSPSRGAVVRGITSRAMALIGRPYRYGSSGPGSFDCSGFVRYVFGGAVSLPRSSREQASCGVSVQRSELEPGDLVFFKTGGSSRINHVGIYIGNGRFVHASTNSGITVTSLDSTYYAARYAGARRVIP